MKIIKTVSEMSRASSSDSGLGNTIGFVPTMGCLHEGHLSLVRASLDECDVTIVSIFVNPSQFGPGEDLEKYPRDIDRDISLLEKEGVDILFVPSPEEMYPEGFGTYVYPPENIDKRLCGISRPGHFRGVATIVAKLFNITSPSKSYFGSKDFQQAAIIKRMVKDLDIGVDIRIMPVIREPDGLAMSSRNRYLKAEQRKTAPALYKALTFGKQLYENGEKDPDKICAEIEKVLTAGPNIKVDYVDIVDVEDLSTLRKQAPAIDRKAALLAAVYLGETRLIDNIRLDDA